MGWASRAQVRTGNPKVDYRRVQFVNCQGKVGEVTQLGDRLYVRTSRGLMRGQVIRKPDGTDAVIKEGR